MRIEEPITVVKANFENEEVRKLKDAIEVLLNLKREMIDRRFTECIWSDYDDAYELNIRQVADACEILQNLTLLSGLQ